MSGESLPITPSAFAEAIQELPLSAVYGKVSELRNSIAHLRRSNAELAVFITESSETEGEKRELETYISENEDVITTMTERIQLLRAEVERRGQLWIEPEEPKAETNGESGPSAAPVVNGTGTRAHGGAASAPRQSTTESSTDRGDEEEGVYL